MRISLTYIVAFFLPLILSLSLTPFVRKMMLRFGCIDMPRESRWHKRPVALMGGIAIFVSFLLVVLLGVNLDHRIIVVLVGGAIVFILGLADDLFGTFFELKLLVQILVAFGVAYFGVAVKGLPYHWMNVSVTVLWIVGLTNALNLLDNMDGLSSGIAIIACLAIFGLSMHDHSLNVALLCLVLAGSCLGFLIYNFNPAKIFMGDNGSLFLGYMLATLTILNNGQGNSWSFKEFLSPALILGIPIFDTMLVTILRLVHGKVPWQGGKDHSSHRLVSVLGGSEKGAVLVLYSLGALAGMLGLVIIQFNSLMAILIAIAFLLGMVFLGVRLARVDCY